MLNPALSTYLDNESSGSSSVKSNTSSRNLRLAALRTSTPLTTENLQYHSIYAAQSACSEDIIRRFQASLDREQVISPTSSTFRRSRRSRSSVSQDTFIESPQYSIFPYHNDSFMVPASPRSSSNLMRSPWASSSTVVGEMSFETSRARAVALGVDRLATKSDPNLLDMSSKPYLNTGGGNTKHIKKRASMPHDNELKLLYTEARRPSRLSVTISKLLQWLTPAGVKSRKDLRRRTTRTWHFRMDD
ncbi:hypothetical protein BGW37DRAFT_498993 [Umbelopsis sp. PMI_123]|nr:hypothetical protein BGW37DRAFT_498993 [Umbelopsis sp. PMI_123]